MIRQQLECVNVCVCVCGRHILKVRKQPIKHLSKIGKDQDIFFKIWHLKKGVPSTLASMVPYLEISVIVSWSIVTQSLES